MHRVPVAAVAIAVAFGASAGASGHGGRDAAVVGGRVHGFVRDAAGAAIVDASVLAIGTTVVAARSDAYGRFLLALPAGDYVLRATRTGYVSTYREPVKVRRAISLERVITLTRQTQAVAEAARVTDTHAHTELAWRLRHLPRSVLRDGGADAAWMEAPSDAFPGQRKASMFWRAVDSSRRMAARLGTTDFDGQLNFVTTATARPSAFAARTLPRSVAYVVFGAPAGMAGDWRIRGAIGSGTESSWNVLGEYEAHGSESHALRFGMSYSAHAPKVSGPGAPGPRSALEARSVTGLFAQDRWRVLDGVEVEYSVRADRYDFLAAPYLVGGRGGIRVRVWPETFMTVRAGRSMFAPGAEEFLPPPADGPWLPVERTFTALATGDPMRAESVRHIDAGLTREFGRAGRRRSLHARAFRQRTADQLATLFSTDADASPGRYRVARAGDVSVSGWAVGVSGALTKHLSGTVEYSRMAAQWDVTSRTVGLRRAAPSAVRDGDEWLDDLTATVEARLNESRTRVVVLYRANTGFARADVDADGPGSRFDVQFRQLLHARPESDHRLELFFSVRNLFRDPASGRSAYDELLTVSPPLRFMGGVQVRF